MQSIKPDEWFPNDGIVLEAAADASVRAETNILVVAGPGAGKTELLAQKAGYLFQTGLCREPRRILAISFKKDAAENLKKRVIKRCGQEVESRFVSVTYDAFSKSLLDHFRYSLPEECRPEGNYLIDEDVVIDAAFKKAGYNNPYNLKKNQLKSYYEKVLLSVSLPLQKDGLAEKVWRLLLKGFDEYQATLTFKMINLLATYIVRTNSKIKKCLQLTYQYVFLDEFQDTTNLQYELVKKCFQNSSSILTAVGDNKQRIMLWAGALKTVFTEFRCDFNAERQQLLMNHRSAPKLIELQRLMYAALEEPDAQIQASDKWSPEDGEIKLLMTSDEEQEAQIVAANISKKIKAGTEPNEICILCKQTPLKYAFEIINQLKKRGIYARIENDYQDLLKEPIVEMLLVMLKLAINRKRPQDWAFILNTTVELTGADSDPTGESYSESQTHIIEELNQVESLMYQVNSEYDVGNIIDNIIVFWSEPKIRAMFSQYNQGTYLEDLLNKFRTLLWRELESTNINWPLAIENFEGVHSVPIMTIHKSKGLEYETVYFVGLEDAAFWNFKNQPQEDRCAFFVALSRAKTEIVFNYSENRSNTWNPQQSHVNINEFFELLKMPGIATIVDSRAME